MPRGDSLPTVWERPPHTEAKHDILTRYLGAWFGIFGLSRHHQAVNVIDGFAGPGRYDDDEPGSPVLTLSTLLDHRSFAAFGDTQFTFVFNEWDGERYASLKDVLADVKASRVPWPKTVRVFDRNQNFQELARELLDSIPAGRQLAPTFAFVDPFGYKDVPMELIRDLVSHPSCELFIYFDFNSANRFAGKGGAVDARFEEMFGCDEFMEAPAKGPERGEFLHDLYESQLKKVCSFAHVRSFAMVNETGHIGNYLFFCTRNLGAFDRMKYAMWSLDRTGEYRFEDRLADQQVLFDDLDTRPLQDELAQHFAGQTVDIDVIRTYVIAETPYYSGHLKRDTLAVMQRAGRISSPNQRQRNKYPDGTLVTFPA